MREMGVANWFENLYSEKKMSSDTITTFSNRYKLITKRLNLDF